MRKMLLVLIILFSMSFAIDPLSFIAGDKRHHIGTTYIITDILRDYFGLNFEDTFVSVGVITITKGMIDYATGGTPDIWDGVANYGGMLLNYLIDPTDDLKEMPDGKK